jgi:XTP/dITP diphosphohydrolase
MDLFLASGNAHKVAEFGQLLAAAPANLAGRVRIRSAKEAGGMPKVEEDTGTFEGNALKKALALRAVIPAEAWALSDDSGLCVDELGGAPGVESAYYAGPQGDSAANLRKLVDIMREVPAERRAAHFRCLLCLVAPDGVVRYFDGRCPGRLAFQPAGEGGFGYDPLFVPEGHSRSFSELGEVVKNQLSHRGLAWKKLETFLAGLGCTS